MGASLEVNPPGLPHLARPSHFSSSPPGAGSHRLVAALVSCDSASAGRSLQSVGQWLALWLQFSDGSERVVDFSVCSAFFWSLCGWER